MDKLLDELKPLLFAWVKREVMLALDAEQNEPDDWITEQGNHIPLDKNGKPMSKVGKKIFGQEKKQTKQDISSLLTPDYTGLKGADAINKLLQEKKGYVKGAFHREDIGDIDIFWGHEGIGLKHIIAHRGEEKNVDLKKLLVEIPETIEKGSLRVNDEGAFEIWHNGNMAVIYPEFKGNKITFVFTAYRARKPSYLK